VAIHAQPIAQAIARGVVEWQPALMHPPNWRLAADQQSRVGADVNDRPRLETKPTGARPARANIAEQVVERRRSVAGDGSRVAEGFDLFTGHDS
jgi:hypothetical protein